MRTFLSLSALVVLLAVATPARAGTPVSGFADTLAVSGLSGPTAIAFLPDGRLLIVARLHERGPGTRSGLNREAALARIERGFGAAFRLVKAEDADFAASQGSKSGLIVRLERG